MAENQNTVTELEQAYTLKRIARIRRDLNEELDELERLLKGQPAEEDDDIPAPRRSQAGERATAAGNGVHHPLAEPSPRPQVGGKKRGRKPIELPEGWDWSKHKIPDDVPKNADGTPNLGKRSAREYTRKAVEAALKRSAAKK